jgi:hypothetical protein
MCELSLPQLPKARHDHPQRAKEFRARDLPPNLKGLFTDAGVGAVRCISSNEVFRSNDYASLQAHWYHGQKKAYVTAHQCRSTGELVRKRADSPKMNYRGDSTLNNFKSIECGLGYGQEEVTIQRPCRSRHLPLNAVFDPLNYMDMRVNESPSSSGSIRKLRMTNLMLKTPGGEQVNVTELLGEIPLFQPLDPDEREQLARGFTAHLFKPGECVINEGDPGDSMYIVAHGAAEVEISTVGVVGFYHQGDYFGEAAIMRGEPRAATIRATQDLHVLRLGIEQFEPMKPLLTKARLKRFRRTPTVDKNKKYNVPHVGFADNDDTNTDEKNTDSGSAQMSEISSPKKTLRRTVRSKTMVRPR